MPNIYHKNQLVQDVTKKRLQFKINQRSINDNKLEQESQSKQIIINVYNYFLPDFPKQYIISPNDTLEGLKEKIIQDTQIRMVDIKNFKDQRQKIVNDNIKLCELFQNNSNLSMEIYFNEGIQITINNKSIQYIMHENNKEKTDFTEVYKAIAFFKNSEKGGKIVVGVEPNGMIKGINIPNQDLYKENFISKFNKYTQNSQQILKDVEISFFRVKGQSKDTYNYHDHKKIMMIKIKGKNQQSKDNSQQISDLEEDKISQEQSPLNQSLEHNTTEQFNLSLNDQLNKYAKIQEVSEFVKKVENLYSLKNIHEFEQFEILLNQW